VVYSQGLKAKKNLQELKTKVLYLQGPKNIFRPCLF